MAYSLEHDDWSDNERDEEDEKALVLREVFREKPDDPQLSPPPQMMQLLASTGYARHDTKLYTPRIVVDFRQPSLGHGALSFVYHGSFGVRPAAVKIIDPSKTDEDTNRKRDDLISALVEYNMLSRLPVHPNVIRAYSIETATTSAYIAVEKCWMDCHLLLNGKRHLMNGYWVDKAIRQIFSGMCELHENGIVHRDLKPSKVYVAQDPSGGRALRFVIGGFRHSCHTSEASREEFSIKPHHKLYWGTPETMELNSTNHVWQTTSKPVPVTEDDDQWSLGFLMYLFCHHKKTPQKVLTTSRIKTTDGGYVLVPLIQGGKLEWDPVQRYNVDQPTGMSLQNYEPNWNSIHAESLVKLLQAELPCNRLQLDEMVAHIALFSLEKICYLVIDFGDLLQRIRDEEFGKLRNPNYTPHLEKSHPDFKHKYTRNPEWIRKNKVQTHPLYQLLEESCEDVFGVLNENGETELNWKEILGTVFMNSLEFKEYTGKRFSDLVIVIRHFVAHYKAALAQVYPPKPFLYITKILELFPKLAFHLYVRGIQYNLMRNGAGVFDQYYKEVSTTGSSNGRFYFKFYQQMAHQIPVRDEKLRRLLLQQSGHLDYNPNSRSNSTYEPY